MIHVPIYIKKETTAVKNFNFTFPGICHILNLHILLHRSHTLKHKLTSTFNLVNELICE